MASGKRQPSKDKRAAQNRAQRAALAARRDAAAGSRAGSSSARPAAAGQRGGLLGRLRGQGGRTGGTASVGGIRATAAAGRAAQPVGYRAALSALLMSLAGVVFTFTFPVAIDANDDAFTRESLIATWAGSALDAAADSPGATPADVADAIDEWTPGRSETPIAVALWPFSLTFALPVIGAALGFRAVSKRSSSRIVSRSLFATLFGSLLSQVPVFFLPSVIALGVAVFQVRKYETALAAAALADQPDDDVIDADVIDADVIDADVIDAEVVATDEKGDVQVVHPEDVEPVRPDER